MTSGEPNSRSTGAPAPTADTAGSADTPHSRSAAAPPRREFGASTAHASGGGPDASDPVDSGEGSAVDASTDLLGGSAGEGEVEATTAVAPTPELDELAAVTAERDKYLALAQRTQADFENYRKRTAKEARVAEMRGVNKLAKELLPALDNLQRALAGADQDDPMIEGVRLVQSDLLAALARLGIESFSPLGEVFDPNDHEAVAHTPVDGAQAGTVAEVYQAGYRHGDAVIRPARVVVAA